MTNRERQLTVLLLKEKLERVSGKKVILKESLQILSIEKMSTILQNSGKYAKVLLNMKTPVKVNQSYIDENGVKQKNPCFSKDAGNSYNSLLKKINTVEGIINFDYYQEVYKKIIEKETLRKHLEKLGIDTNNKTSVIDWYKEERVKKYKEPETISVGAIKLSDKGEYYMPLLDPSSAYGKKETMYELNGKEFTYEEIEKFLPPSNSNFSEKIVDELEIPRVNIQQPKLSNITSLVLGNTEYQISGVTKNF